MGFHTCKFCDKATSSGDVTLRFTSGHTWVMPDMILHYVAEHDYQPPAPFVEDVLGGAYVGGLREQTKSGLTAIHKVGYLADGDFPMWLTNASRDQFFVQLWRLMELARKGGDRVQTRGAVINNPRLSKMIDAFNRGHDDGSGATVPVS